MKPINRISDPSYSTFLDFIAAKQPVIIEGLFRRQELGRIRTAAQARRSFEHLKVSIRPEYSADFLKHRNVFRHDAKLTTFATFLNLLDRKPDSRMVVTEYPTPMRLTHLFEVPNLCQYRYGADGTERIASELFIAGAGNVAHLHFDWDHKHVLLHQVFGRKRVCLVRPEKSALLNPVLNFSQLNLERLLETDRRRILKSLCGYETVLRPGETLYIPPLMWHCFQYLDTAMSISFRFGRTVYGRLFQERFHPNMHLQNFAWYTIERDRLSGVALEHFRRILREYITAPRAGFRLYKRMQRIFETVYLEFCTSSVQETCWLPASALTEEQVRLGIRAGLLYPRKLNREVGMKEFLQSVGHRTSADRPGTGKSRVLTAPCSGQNEISP